MATGVSFRTTSGYVTDGASDTYSLGAAYPETRGGITFGWESDMTGNARDRAIAAQDLAGLVFQANGGTTKYFRYDCTAGTYTVRVALGDAINVQTQKLVIKDGVGGSTLATITGSTGAAEWLDAAGTLRASYALWQSNNTGISLTQSSGAFVFEIGDTAGANATTLSKVDVIGVSDTTAPTLTSPTGTGSTLTSAGGVTTDEGNGTLYMVSTASASAPTKTQVKTAKDHLDATALRASNSAVSSTGAKTFSAASCTAGTRYNHYMHEDAAGNQSNVVTSASFVVGSGVTFSGTVPAQSGVTGDSFSLDLSTYFSGNMTRTYAVQSGSLTSSGLSLNTSTGIVSGTLGTVGAYSISVRATDTYSDTDDTNSFTITVSSTGTAPTVSTHPSNTTVTAGATASFTAAASGSPTPTVQWQENTGSWSNISGQTTTTLSLGIVGTPDNGRQVRAVFTNSSGSATTNTATLTVNAAAGDGTITSEPLGPNLSGLNGAGTLTWVGFRNASTGADVLLLTNVSINSSSVFTTGLQSALAPGQLYAINWKTSDGKYGYAWANAV